ncbi:MAG: alkaline phosphatase D family protein [Pseudomonadales bacterium]|nr:alkaline phosphatase D family protein [Pseudomonadales bacterium]
MYSPHRRKFLSYLGATLATPFILSACGSSSNSAPASSSPRGLVNNETLNRNSSAVFDYSIASGDPTPSGVILWAHIAEQAYRPQQALIFQVANSDTFSDDALVLEGKVPALEINRLTDFTVHVDLDGLLPASNTRYFYRFVYDNTVSRTGRCKTTPADGESIEKIKFAQLNCQDFSNGYYNALSLVADDDSIDFVIHLGDFIYETGSDLRVEGQPFEDRRIELPSGALVAMDLEDYRTLYRAYRRDPMLQRAMENHTWIITTDDHETADDCYWDYERDTLGAPEHPYTTDPQFGNSAALLTQLKLHSQQAWYEYVPVRASLNLNASHPHQALTLYRDFRFGGLVELFMTDTRSYRSPHPCGEKSLFQRYLPLCDLNQVEQSLYGPKQRDWVMNGLSDSSCQWKVLGNQTFMGRLGIYLQENKQQVVQVDAWDGYSAERRWLMEQVKTQNIENLVVLTGDLHSTIASYLKEEYDNQPISEENPPLGVEFMAPAITSASLGNEILKNNPEMVKEKLLQSMAYLLVRGSNVHIRYFDSVNHGYSTVEFTPNYCEWRAYKVDKDVLDETPKRTQITAYRKYPDRALLQHMSPKRF